VALAVLLAWLIPGLGHASVGRARRGLGYFLIVSTAFLVGLALRGGLPAPDREHPLTILAAATGRATGLLDLAAKAKGLGDGDPASRTFEYGTTYLASAGVMNLLLIFDVVAVARGRKA
jgi:hypothetical protein